MKKYLLLLPISVLIFTLSCSSESDSDDLAEPQTNIPNTDSDPAGEDPDPDAVTYTGNIEAIIQANCTSCHGDPPTQNAPMPLLDLASVREAVDNRDLLGRINSSTNPMPPAGRLPLATRQLFEEWVDLGMPE